MTARLLHTSDWHLGVRVRGESREVDHDAVIDEILGAAEDFKPDLILHTGDLFDGFRPSHADMLRALRAVRRLATVAPVLVLSGNHDSPACFELLAEAVGAAPPQSGWDPYAACDIPIRFLHKPCTPDAGAVATYTAADGTPIRVGCLPFVHANRVITGFEDVPLLNATYTDKVRHITKVLSDAVFERGDSADIVGIWASHLHIDGAKTSSERAIHISESYATDAAHLHAGFSYLAFGHIHRPQEIPGGRGRYAGSPLEIDFGEEGERKTVVCVTAEPVTRARIEPHELSAGRRIRRVRSTLAGLPELSADLGDAICVVTVDDGPETVESLNQLVRGALPNACVVQVIDGRKPAEVSLDELVDTDGAPEETLSIAYRRYLTEGEGDPHVAAASLTRVAELFDELLAAVENADDPDPAEAATLQRLETVESTRAATAPLTAAGGD